jgi:signal transduction histidine kinase/DNA-binding NarL/FixJ family response regulator
MDGDSRSDLRVLVCAPIGRDSGLTIELLERASIECLACRSLQEVGERLAEGAGAILLTEEALADPNLDALAAALATQAAWSDISVLLFAGGRRDEAALRTLRKLEILRNVTLLDRPVRTSAVISTVQAALRGRRRQYELRDVLVALHKARSDAEEANRLKDEFLATVSHELRTPLNAIMGWVSLLRQARMEPSRVDAVLAIVERNAKSQAQIIADVLDISRMVSGRIKLNQQPVSLARVVLEALDTIRPAAAAKGVEIHTDIDEGPIVQADAERLQQVFWNVFSNACKFTPSGGRIDVRLRGGLPWSTLRVTDSGSGIPAEFLPYVFDRFRQADQSFTRSHGGLGLGLAIVKYLVEMHGGEVTAASGGVGQGATFEIRLPAERASRRKRTVEADESGAAPAPDIDFREQLVLVVDDDESTRDLMRTVLSDCGARVIAVQSAAEAVAQLDLEVPAAIVADIGMPGEDGLSMMRRIRQRPAARGGTVPAVALSAYARGEDRQAALEAGFTEFITKPALPHEVAAVVAALARPPRLRARKYKVAGRVPSSANSKPPSSRTRRQRPGS